MTTRLKILLLPLTVLAAAAFCGCKSGYYVTAEGEWAGRLAGVAYEGNPRASNHPDPHTVAVIVREGDPPPTFWRAKKTNEIVGPTDPYGIKIQDTILVDEKTGVPYLIKNGVLTHPTLRVPEAQVGDRLVIRGWFSTKVDDSKFSVATRNYPGDQIIVEVVEIVSVDNGGRPAGVESPGPACRRGNQPGDVAASAMAFDEDG
jgi:hypothetical protein